MYTEEEDGWRKPTLAEICMILKLGSLFSSGKPQGVEIITLSASSVQAVTGANTGDAEGVVYAAIFVKSVDTKLASPWWPSWVPGERTPSGPVPGTMSPRRIL